MVEKAPTALVTLTQQHLRSRLRYDPETGDFIWLKRPVRSRHDRMWNTRYAGTRAGATVKSSGGLPYLKIRIDGKAYFAHRLAWIYMTGEFPPDQIDHEDTDGLNNRWKNLRLANRSQNGANRGANSNNTTGLKGVSFNKHTGRYEAKVKVRGKSKYLGLFDTPEEGHAVYMQAAEKHFGEFARTAT